MVQCHFAKDQSLYLMFIVTSKQELMLRGIPIVNEYQDVFSNDITTLSPKQDIKFSIDLIPGAEPIFVVPYRMYSVELKELKAQFKELIHNNFIRPFGVHQYCW